VSVRDKLRLAAESCPWSDTSTPNRPDRIAKVVSKCRWVSEICCCFGVLYLGEVSSESCPLILLMGENLF
jgi:hypothetical protein